jgi:O-antigen ligase
MLIALTVVCLVSLLLRVWHPALAFEQTFEGPRFRGLFSKPAMMGAASGLLFGLCLFVPWHWSIRGIGIAASLPCLFLTGSRTFWVAATVSMGAAGIRYVRWRRTFVPMVAVLIVAVLGLGIVIGTQMTQAQGAKIFRQDSIENLSGRTAMWAQALQRYWEHPWLGYGFTAGGVVLDETGWRGAGGVSSNSPSQGAITLHNGYVQALLDSGGIGAALYVAVILSALLCFLWYDGAKQYAAEFYCLLFLAIANLGETVIFGAAVLHGVWFWYVTVLALTLPSLASQAPLPEPVDSVTGEAALGVEAGWALTPGVPEPRRFPLVQSRETRL